MFLNNSQPECSGRARGGGGGGDDWQQVQLIEDDP